jgi:hypothetical protein
MEDKKAIIPRWISTDVFPKSVSFDIYTSLYTEKHPSHKTLFRLHQTKHKYIWIYKSKVQVSFEKRHLLKSFNRFGQHYSCHLQGDIHGSDNSAFNVGWISADEATETV